ncbi:uncharacterized protein LOC120328317 [Styela clava]
MLRQSWLTALLCTLSTIDILLAQKIANVPYLVWTSANAKQRSTGVYTCPALPENQQKSLGRVLTSKIASLRYPHYLAALANNDATQEVTAVDIGRGNIVTFSLHRKSIVRHHGGVSRKVGGVAVDWSSGNIYWTDEELRWIVAAKFNLVIMTPIVTNVVNPRGIAIHPMKGYLFWSQANQQDANSGVIMRSTMSGSDPKLIHTSFGRQTALSIDYETDRLYWVDSTDNAVWSIDVDGKESANLVYTDKNSQISGLAVFRKSVYIADKGQNQIVTINKENGGVENKLPVSSPHDVAVVGGNSQPEYSGPCDIKNGGCEELCFPQPPGNVSTCGCSLGLDLAPDGKSCISVLIEKDFFVAVDADMHWIFQISADGSQYTRLKLPGVRVPVQVEFDPETKMVYWTDVGMKSVNSAKWDGTEFKVLAKANVRQPTGLSLDKMSGNLYWTDEGTGTINVIRVDGTHRKTLLSTGIRSPRALAIDPFLGLMWWSDWMTKTIEMATMDGKNRQKIVTTEVNWPNGIAVDHQEKQLYWVDAHRDKIYVSDHDGKNKRVFKSFRSVHMFGITVDKDYVYWTDWNDHSVMRVKKASPQDKGEPFGPKIFSKLCDIHNFIETRSINDMEKLHHPCRVNNGNCTGLCLPVPKSPSDSSNESSNVKVTRVCVCGTQHNGTCDEPQKGVADTQPPTFGKTCPENMIFTAAPCQTKVLVNYTVPVASDNSGRVALSKSPKNLPPIKLEEGRYEHIYIATDAAGNTDKCHFSITIKVVRCPSAQSYAKSFDDVKIDSMTCDNLLGSRVNVTCTNGKKVMLTNHFTCGVNGKWKGEPACLDPNKDEGVDEEDKTGINETTANVNGSSTKPNKPNTTTATPTTSIPVTKPKVFTVNPTTKTKVKNTTQKDEEMNEPVKQRNAKMELAYLLIPVVVVLIIVLVAAIGYRYCKNPSMPLIESMEKRLTFFNLKKGDSDTVAFGGDNIQQRQRTQSMNNVVDYASTSRVPTVSDDSRRQSLPETQAIYAEPADDQPIDISSRPPLPHRGGYGTLN